MGLLAQFQSRSCTSASPYLQLSKADLPPCIRAPRFSHCPGEVENIVSRASGKLNFVLGMYRSPHLLLAFSLLAAGLATGCKPKSAGSGSPAGYFATPFQSESQFIVEAIVSDLAEQMSYAASQRLPDKKRFLVTATEKPGSPLDAPVYEVSVRLAPNQRDLKTEVSINGPIWSPAVYEALAGELARAVGLSGNHQGTPDDTALLSKLTDNTAETIEEQNQAISAALEKDFRNPGLHEDAAMLLGALDRKSTRL